MFHNRLPFRTGSLLLGLLALLSLSACDNELDITAEFEPNYVVYGVLNPDASEQVIRLSKVFLTDQDALQFATENDLSVANARVWLVRQYTESGQPQTDSIALQAQEFVRQPGVFPDTYTGFVTTTPLEAGDRYSVYVEIPDEQDPAQTAVYLTAECEIPAEPDIIESGDNRDNNDTVFPTGNVPKFRELDYSAEVTFALDASSSNAGRAFQLRIFTDYGIHDLVADDTTFYGPLVVGPTPLISDVFISANSNTRRDRVPYTYPLGAITDNLNRQMAQAGHITDSTQVRILDVGNLSNAMRVEFTALDAQLYSFLQANAPQVSDFTTVRPTFTNVRRINAATGDTSDAVGVLGAINARVRPYRAAPCTEVVLQANNIPLSDCQRLR